MRIAQQPRQRFRIHGFDEMHVETGIRGFAPVLVLSPAGDRDQAHVAAPGRLPDATARFVAVHPGHAQVEEHRLRMKCLGKLESLFSVMRNTNLMPDELQERRQAGRHVAVIVDDQNLQLVVGRRLVGCSRRVVGAPRACR